MFKSLLKNADFLIMASHPHFLWKDLFQNARTEKGTVLEVMRENVLFCTLSNSELEYLSRVVYERVYQPNEPIFFQGDRGFGMYLIAKGKVAIKSDTNEGQMLVTHLGKGSFFGELSLVEPGNIRTASATAQERTVVIGFFKPDLVEILERKPGMGVKILFQLSTVLGRRLMETTDKITLITQAKGVTDLNEEII